MSRKFHEKVENINPAFRWRDVPRALWYFLQEDRLKFSVSFFILFLIFFYELLPAMVAGKIVDFFTNYHAGDSLKTFYGYVIFLGVTIPLAGLIRIGSRKILSAAGYTMRARARVQGFERLTEQSMQWHAQENSGSKVQRIYTGSLALKEWARIIGGQLLSIGASTVGILVVFLYANFWLGLFLFTYIVVFLVVEIYYNKKLSKLSDEFNALDQKAGGMYVEGAGNMLALKATGSTHAMTGKVRANERRVQDVGVLRSKTGFTKWQIFRVIDGPFVIVFFLIIAHGITTGIFSAGMILVFFTYFMKLSYEIRGQISDIDEVIIDIKSGLGNMMPIFWEKAHVPTGEEEFPEDWNELRMENATLAYPSGQLGLTHLKFHIKRNEKLGIAGSSGSGKSTLVKALLGLYQLKEGEFTVGPHDYYSIAHEKLLHHMAVVLQETELFNITLRENITMMREENPELLRQAIRISQLEEVVSRLPQGVDTLIGERGYMLSGGERQRLGIARAIYKDAEIMIFDEATSSLDSETERKIMEQLLGEYGKDRTMILIAHRLATLAHTDRVAVFDKGTIVEEGTYNKLLAKESSILSRLSKTQAHVKEH